MPSAKPNLNGGQRPKGAKPESWLTPQPDPTPQPATKTPSERLPPVNEAAAKARADAEAYAEKMNRRKRK